MFNTTCALFRHATLIIYPAILKPFMKVQKKKVPTIDIDCQAKCSIKWPVLGVCEPLADLKSDSEKIFRILKKSCSFLGRQFFPFINFWVSIHILIPAPER